MNGNKFYKLKLIKKLLKTTAEARNKLMDELVTNATDPTIVKRRIRMIKQVNSFESQLIEKINNFETDDIQDLITFNLHESLKIITHPSA